MIKVHHIYTTNEINNSNQPPLSHNWGPTNYLTNVNINDPNAGVRNISFVAFNNKLNALIYFRDFIANIQKDFPNKNYFLKLSQIDNSINLLKANKSDQNIELNIIDFDFEDLSISTYNSGYWPDSVKLILNQIVEEIDVYFEILSFDDIENSYSNLNNSKFSTHSLKEIQVECANLVNYKDICNPTFIEKFNILCQYMNDFWNYWFE